MKSFQIVRNIYKQVFKTVPFSSALTILNYISAGVMPAAATFIMTRLFDNAYKFTQGEQVKDTMFLYGILYLVTYLINDLLYFISSITINGGIYEKCSHYYRIMLGEKTAKLPLIAFENAEILNKKRRAEDCVNSEILSQIFMQCLVFTTSAVSVVGVVVVLAGYSLWFLPISLLSVLPYFIARLIRGQEFYHVKSKQAKKVRRMDYLWSLFNNKNTIKEMRVMGFDDYITNNWTKVRDEVNEELWTFNKKDSKSLLLCDAIRIIGYAASIALTLLLTLKGNITIGLFGACLAAFKNVQEQIKVFLIDFGRMPEQLAFARDYFDFLGLAEEVTGEIEFDGLRNDITAHNLYFKYPNAQEYAIKKVHLTINKGEKIAVLGENGSGKTTLSKLLLGLYPSSEGEVLYDNINIKEFDIKSIYKKVSAIAQNFAEYNLTLRENVAMSDTSKLKADEDIIKAINEVGLELIIAEVGGLDGELGREFGGSELSGGQWQKLAIARALYKDSELIILDEPTSALDPLIETEVLTKFIELVKNKTAMIISHRVGLCKLVDRIVVMKKGEIAEVGTHSELMKLKGEYFRLYTAQEKWYI